MIGAPPFEVGAVHESATCVSLALPAKAVGAAGVVNGTDVTTALRTPMIVREVGTSVVIAAIRNE